MIVYLSSPDEDIQRMWENNHYKVSNNLGTHVDLVQFTGGEDVCPALYNSYCHKHTYFDFKRDLHDYKLFRKARDLGIPCAGICRGAQFLHVMMGGRLYQHIDNHAGKEHEIRDEQTGEIFKTNSFHHQCVMMTNEGNDRGFKVLARAKEASKMDRMSLRAAVPEFEREEEHSITLIRPVHYRDWFEIEAYWYDKQNILGFQGHPEWPCSEQLLAMNYQIWIEEYILK